MIKIIGSTLAFIGIVFLAKTILLSSEPNNTRSVESLSPHALTEMGQKFVQALKEDKPELADKIMWPSIEASWREMNSLTPAEKETRPKGWGAYFTKLRINTPTKYLSIAAKKLGFKPGDRLIDVGSGHGVPAVIFAALHPEMKITGYELVPEKVYGSKRLAYELGIKGIKFIEQDLGENGFVIKEAEYYYLFNPAYKAITDTLAKQIAEHSKKLPVKVILYGPRIDSIIWTHSSFREAGFEIISDDDFFKETQMTVYKHPDGI